MHNIEIHNMNTTGSSNASVRNQTSRYQTKTKSEPIGYLLWLWAGFTIVFVLVLNMLRRPVESCWVYFPYILIMMFGFGILPTIAERIEDSLYETWDNNTIDFDINAWIDGIKVMGMADINALKIEKIECGCTRNYAQLDTFPNYTELDANVTSLSVPNVHSRGCSLAKNFYANIFRVMRVVLQLVKSQLVQVGPKSAIPEVPDYQMREYAIILCLACGLLALIIILCCVSKCVLH